MKQSTLTTLVTLRISPASPIVVCLKHVNKKIYQALSILTCVSASLFSWATLWSFGWFLVYILLLSLYLKPNQRGNRNEGETSHRIACANVIHCSIYMSTYDSKGSGNRPIKFDQAKQIAGGRRTMHSNILTHRRLEHDIIFDNR